MLVYQGISFLENGHFSYPHLDIIDRWHELGKRLVAEDNVGNRLYLYFKELGCYEINIKTHQPVLITAEEKSLYRLGLITAKDSFIEHGILTETEYENWIKELTQIENQDAIIDFFRNILIGGRK